MRWLACALGLGVATAGCSLLFPEFNGTPPDAATDGDGAVLNPDGGGGPRLEGAVCALSDVRDFRSCVVGPGSGLRVTVEETRESVMVGANGAFVLPLAKALEVATVAAVDPSGAFAPTVTEVHLQSGVALGVALPMVAAAALTQAATSAGVTLDPARGVLLAWAIDPHGAPLANALAATPGAAPVGPLSDGDASGQLVFSASTGKRGLIALFDLPSPTITVALTPPPSTGLRADQFPLPVRPGAITITTLVLPPL